MKLSILTLGGWIWPFATAAILLACGGAPTTESPGQSSEALSSATTAEPPNGHCNVVWTDQRHGLYQTGLCVLDGDRDAPVCLAVESPQCEKFKEGNAYNCACGTYPDCTFVDTVDCVVYPLPPGK
jgi:hypothetical protein